MGAGNEGSQSYIEVVEHDPIQQVNIYLKRYIWHLKVAWLI